MLSQLVAVVCVAVLCGAVAVPQPKDITSLQFVSSDKLSKRYYDYGDDSANDPVRGVNIGGWLVLEPYITPSLFEAFRTNDYNDDGIPVDEYHYCEYLGTDEAMHRLVDHWETFYTEQDFIDIANHGFNLVRIPIGYWAYKKLDSDPYVSTLQQIYLERAINWARANSLKVWIDLHGAAGSQNGFDNSGLRDQIEFLNDETNLAVTTDVLNILLEKYSTDEYKDTVIGIELLNEPLGPSIDMDKLKNEYLLPAYDYLRNNLKNDQIVIIHDAFEAFNYWDDFLTLDQGAYGVVIDHHHYQVFSSGELQRSWDDRLGVTCSWGTGAANEYHWTVAGEFSAALTDCAKWLNGVGIGARYDGTFNKNDVSSYYIGSCDNNEDVSTWSDERKELTRRYIEAQFDAFEMNGGWIIWCYKTETSVEWGVNQLIANDLFPQPLTARNYPNQCSA